MIARSCRLKMSEVFAFVVVVVVVVVVVLRFIHSRMNESNESNGISFPHTVL